MHAYILRIEAQGLAMGVDIGFLSLYPKEQEFLYPPLTYLMQKDQVTVQDGITIVKITPQIS